MVSTVALWDLAWPPTVLSGTAITTDDPRTRQSC
jgi:hypothetical protein